MTVKVNPETMARESTPLKTFMDQPVFINAKTDLLASNNMDEHSEEKKVSNASLNEVNKLWKLNDKALAIIINNVSKAHQVELLELTTALEAFQHLESKYAANRKMSRLRLLGQLFHFRLSHSSEIDDHLLRFDTTLAQLNSIGFALQDELPALALLHSLPTQSQNGDSYTTFIELIESSAESDDSKLSYHYVKNRLRQEAMKRIANAADSETQRALAMPKFKKKSGAGNGGGGETDKRKCFSCGREGHVASECRSSKAPKEQARKPSPSSKKDKQPFKKQTPRKSNGSNDEIVLACIEDPVVDHVAASACDTQIEWLVDSACSGRHATGNIDAFLPDSLVPCTPKTWSIGNGTRVTGSKAGRVRLIDAVNRTVVLSEVYYVPHLAHNLISVDRLVETGAIKKVVFSKKKGLISGTDVSLVCIRHKGCWMLRSAPPSHNPHLGNSPAAPPMGVHVSHSGTVTGTREEKTLLLHRRYGHLGLKSLLAMAQVPNPPFTKEDLTAEMPYCGECSVANFRRLPHPAVPPERKHVTKVLEELSMDIVGPFPVLAMHNATKYFLLVMDTKTHFSAVFPLRSKDEVSAPFINFIAEAERLHGQKVISVHCDAAKENLQGALGGELKRMGIRIDHTTRDSPESNGLCERRAGILQSMARAMRVTASKPKSYWWHAVNYANDVANITPSPTLGGSSPQVQWFGYERTPPSMLRVLFSECVVRLADAAISKDSNRGISGSFIGLNETKRAYQILDDTGVVHNSRDVVFNECSFPHMDRAAEQGYRVAVDVDDVALRDSEEKVIVDERPTQLPTAQPTPDVAAAPTPPAPPLAPSPDPPPAPRRSARGWKPTAEGLESHAQRITKTHFPRPEVKERKAVEEEDEEEVHQHDAFIMASSILTSQSDSSVPSLKKALRDDDWLKAVIKEQDNHQRLASFQELPTDHASPPPRDVIPAKYLLTTKSDGRKKARLVLCGNARRDAPAMDVYSPVANIVTIRTITALAAARGWRLHHADATAAYLNAYLSTPVYARIPLVDPSTRTRRYAVCLVVRAIYGLQESGKCWYEVLTNHLVSNMHFTKSSLDPCLFIKDGNIIASTVDDLLIGCPDVLVADKIIDQISSRFELGSVEDAARYTGIEMIQQPDGITLHQSSYATKVVDRAGFSDSSAVPTPMTKRIDESMRGNEDDLRSTVGSLLYLTHLTRPDLQYCVNSLARVAAKPTDDHHRVAHRALRYLSSHLHLGIHYRRAKAPDPTLFAYVDSDHATAPDGKSMTGFVILLSPDGKREHAAPIHWKSSRSTIVALSSAEAEYTSMTPACRDIVYIRYLLDELGAPQRSPTVLFSDNTAAIDCVLSGEYRSESKLRHVELKFHYVRSQQGKTVDVQYVPSDFNYADAFTKPMNPSKHKFFFGELLCDV